MTDITIVWTGTRGDYVLSGADLLSSNDLQTAMLISLFTDREAAVDDVPPDGSTDPRGWWGDDGGDAPRIGSRLWLLDRSKRMPEVLARAKSYAAEALQWMVDDGVVASFDITADWLAYPLHGFGLRVVALKNDGRTVAMAFNWAWQ